MSATTNGDIHVGDVGTRYHLPTYDTDLARVNFDPTDATLRQLRFDMPKLGGGTLVLTRDALALQVLIEGVLTWCLVYQVASGDLVADGFHQAPGKVQLQGYVEFSPEQKWASNIVDVDRRGRQLTIAPNLAPPA